MDKVALVGVPDDAGTCDGKIVCGGLVIVEYGLTPVLLSCSKAWGA